MTKFHVLGIAVLVLLAAGGWGLFAHTHQTQATVTTKTEKTSQVEKTYLDPFKAWDRIRGVTADASK